MTPFATLESHMRDDKPTGGEMFEEVLELITGLGVMLLPVLLLAIPCMVLLLPLVLLGIPFLLLAALLTPPFLVVRALRHRSSRGARAEALTQ
jgi:hypothetical protein